MGGVTPELVEAFGRDGAVCVRGTFSADELSLLERGIEQNLASPSSRALVASRPDDPGRFFEEFVAGTHLGPWLMPRTLMAGEAKWFPEGTLDELPDVEGNRGAFRILAWELEPGDGVFFHMLTLHAAGGATRRRRAFSIRFLGDDAVHAPRRWKTSPEFPGLEEQVAAGAEFNHPLFPVVWPP